MGQERPAPASTGSRTTRYLGSTVGVGMLALALLSFLVVPEDDLMRDSIRLMFVHVPSAMLTYVAFLTTAIGSVMWLWKRSVWWDIVAHSAAEVGVLFCAVTLATGSIWARTTWNTYWEWGDVLLMTTLILLLMMIGYLAVRSIGGEADAVATRAAVVALIAAVNLPIVNRSVEWWANRTLHQQSSIRDGRLEDMTLFTLVVGVVVWTLYFTWAMIHRFRLGWLEREQSVRQLEVAIVERRAEARIGGTGT